MLWQNGARLGLSRVCNHLLLLVVLVLVAHLVVLVRADLRMDHVKWLPVLAIHSLLLPFGRTRGAFALSRAALGCLLHVELLLPHLLLQLQRLVPILFLRILQLVELLPHLFDFESG